MPRKNETATSGSSSSEERSTGTATSDSEKSISDMFDGGMFQLSIV